MGIDLIEFGGHRYPAYQAEGNAAQFVLPFARKLCKGVGVDVGCGRAEWCLPGATPVDPAVSPWDALRFPADMGPGTLDYVFSSHTLEHLPDWTVALDHWTAMLRPGGVLFLYLPDYSQVYWRPWNNRKHRHVLTPEVLADYLRDRRYAPVFATGADLNHSFAVVGERGSS